MFCFSVRLLSLLRGHSVFSYPPPRPMTSNFEGFLYQILSITLFFYLNSWERASIFPFQCWVLNKGTSGTIFITSLVWRGPWLGIGPPALEASPIPLGYRGGGNSWVITSAWNPDIMSCNCGYVMYRHNSFTSLWKSVVARKNTN